MNLLRLHVCTILPVWSIGGTNKGRKQSIVTRSGYFHSIHLRGMLLLSFYKQQLPETITFQARVLSTPQARLS